MEDLTRYLIKAKEQEVVSELSAQGYGIVQGKGTADDFDITATRGSERIAVVVKAVSELGRERDVLRRLRDKAEREAFEFRLVIVKPPHQVSVDIDGIAEALSIYLMNNLPSELDAVSSNTIIDEVADIEFDEVNVSQDGIHVRGSGHVGVQLEYGGGEERDGLTLSDGFPFTFDLKLDHDLTIDEVNSIKVDTSDFYE